MLRGATTGHDDRLTSLGDLLDGVGEFAHSASPHVTASPCQPMQDPLGQGRLGQDHVRHVIRGP